MSKTWWTAAGTMAALAGVLLAVAPRPSQAPDDEAMLLVSQAGERRNGPLYFRLEGKPVRGLYPGATRQMRITVLNPLGYRLSMQRLTGTVTATSRRGCPADDSSLRIGDYTGALPVAIAAHGRTTLTGTLPVSMPIGTTEKCAGARFSISMSGSGFRADR
jgi:hypothetical protein